VKNDILTYNCSITIIIESTVKVIFFISTTFVVGLAIVRRGPFYRRTTLSLAAVALIHEAWIEFTSELLELLEIHRSNWPSCGPQSLLKVFPCDFRHRVKVVGLSTFLNQGSHSRLSFNCLNKIQITSLTADFAAFWQISVRSAPENPSVIWATKFKSTSLAIGVFLRLAFKMLNREGKSGRGM